MKRYKRVLSVVLSILIVMNTACGIPDNLIAKATVMRLIKHTGDVEIECDDKKLEIVDNMKFSGDTTIQTDDESSAGVGLDNVKTAVLDENSTARVERMGKDLTLYLDEGDLVFNVSSPLEEDENFDIRTSNMVVGIRGTSGYVRFIDDQTSELILTSGTVEIKAKNRVTGEKKKFQVNAGERLVLVTDEYGINEQISPVNLSEFPEFLIEEIKADEELKEKVKEEAGIDVEAEVEIAAKEEKTTTTTTTTTDTGIAQKTESVEATEVSEREPKPEDVVHISYVTLFDFDVDIKDCCDPATFEAEGILSYERRNGTSWDNDAMIQDDCIGFEERDIDAKIFVPYRKQIQSFFEENKDTWEERPSQNLDYRGTLQIEMEDIAGEYKVVDAAIKIRSKSEYYGDDYTAEVLDKESPFGWVMDSDTRIWNCGLWLDLTVERVE